MRISRDLGLGKRSIALAVKLLDHPCGDAGGDGIERDVVGHKTEGAHNRIFAYCDARHDNTVAANLTVLF